MSGTEPSTTPVLLIEQARALAQIEEARFAAAQTRATALLAVTGVLAGIGGTIIAGVKLADYHSLALLLAIGLAVASAAALLWTAFLAIGSLQRTSESEPDLEGRQGRARLTRSREEAKLANLSDALPVFLGREPEEISEALLPILAKQTRMIHRNIEDIHDSFSKATRGLAIAVFAGILTSSIVLLGRSTEPQEVRLVEKPKLQKPGLASARLGRHD